MEKKTVFVLGDSISIHYGPFLKKMINCKYNYQQKGKNVDALRELDKPVGANAGDSNMCLEYLRNEYKKDANYNILLMNCGLHDIRVDRITKKIQTEEWQYRENLNRISEIALKMSDRVIWITTTPVVDSIHNRRSGGFLRYSKDVIIYNSIAEKVMDDYQIPCIDMYSLTNSLGNDIYCDHVHFKEEVRALQAAFISEYLLGIR